ncbi:uncharacterized protein J3R85_016182 [Psidium guajava]|nr:uncharacterized protein J3R85_016182 [Psidium guajava]
MVLEGNGASGSLSHPRRELWGSISKRRTKKREKRIDFSVDGVWMKALTRISQRSWTSLTTATSMLTTSSCRQTRLQFLVSTLYEHANWSYHPRRWSPRFESVTVSSLFYHAYVYSSLLRKFLFGVTVFGQLNTQRSWFRPGNGSHDVGVN